MTDSYGGDWSDSGKRSAKKPDRKKGGPSDILRIMMPISNLASLRKGGKVKSKRGKTRTATR